MLQKIMVPRPALDSVKVVQVSKQTTTKEKYRKNDDPSPEVIPFKGEIACNKN